MDVPLSELGADSPWARHGEVLDGKFRIGEILGRGGMGVVVAAHHLDLDEPVALKFILPNGDSTATERLIREARATAKLRSPYVTRVFDVGRTADQLPYIVMERLHGEDLWSRIKTRGSLPVAEAVRYMLQVCEPLEEAHSLGITHRDLKPSNIYLARSTSGETVVKLLDFGISRKQSNEDELTRAGEFLGTPHFMSPEQFTDAREAGPASDIYSLGACLYSILTGRPPFMGGDLLSLAKRVMAEPHQSVRDLRAEIPLPVSKVIDRCLAKRPEDRFASVRDVRDALKPHAAAEAPTRTAHVGDETIVAMQEGRLDHEALRDVDAHVATCEECRQLLAVASPASMIDSMRTLEPTLPAATPQGPVVTGTTLISGEIPGERTLPISSTFAAIQTSAHPPVSIVSRSKGWVVFGAVAIALLALGGIGIRAVRNQEIAQPPAALTEVPAATPTPVAVIPSAVPEPVVAPPEQSVQHASTARPSPGARPKRAASTPTSPPVVIPNER